MGILFALATSEATRTNKIDAITIIPHQAFMLLVVFQTLVGIMNEKNDDEECNETPASISFRGA